MKPVVKYAIYAVVAAAVVYAGMKAWKLYQAKKAAKEAAV